MVTMKKSVTMEAVKSLLLEWDGDGSGLEAVGTAGGTLYKVADVIVQNEDIPGMTVTDSEGKETLVTDSIYNDMISRSLVGDGFAAKVAGYVYLAQKEAQAPGAELPAGGIWLLKKQDGSYPKKVVLPAYREAFLQGEKPDGEQGESMGGGVTSWNDLKDRPFGDNRTEEEVTIEWDGNTNGLVNADWYYKVSDITPSFAEIKTGVVVINANGNKSSYDLHSGSYAMNGSDIVVDDDDNRPLFLISRGSESYPEAGLYFYNSNGYFTERFTYTAKTGEVKTIDYLFMPPGYPKTEQGEKVLFETELEGGVVELEGDVVTLEEGKTYTVILDSGSYNAVCKSFDMDGLTMLYLGNMADMGGEDTGESFLVGVVPGMAFSAVDKNSGSKIAIAGVVENITPMAAKFMPDPSDLSAEWIAALKTALGI